MTADIKTVLTDEQIAQMARSNEVYSDYHGENVLDEQAFARDIERAVLAASDERKESFEQWAKSKGLISDVQYGLRCENSNVPLLRECWQAAIAAGKAGEVKS